MGLILYLAGLAISVYVMVMYSDPRLFGLFIALIITGFAGLIMAWIWVIRVRTDLEAAASFDPEEAHVVRLTLNLYKGGLLPIGMTDIRLRYRNDFDHGKGHKQWVRLYADGSRKTASVQLMLESSCCGCIQIRADRIRVRDYLGIWRFSKKLDIACKVLMMPEVRPVNVMPSGELMQYIGDADVFSETESGNDPSEVFDVREYHPGDALSRIHWKLSARKDETMVKQLSKPLVMPLVVAVSLWTADDTHLLNRVNALMTAAMSLCSELMKSDCAFILVAKNMADRWQCHMMTDQESLHKAIQDVLRTGCGKSEASDPMAWYVREFGRDSYYTFLNLDLEQMALIKDGEAIAGIESEGYPFSGKDILL